MRKAFFFFAILASLHSKGQLLFNQYYTGANQDLYDVRMVNTTTGYASGNKGLIAKTQDGGTTWSPLNTGTNKAIWQTASAPADTIGTTFYAVTDLSLIMKTTDGGSSFQFLTIGLPAGSFLTGVQCLDNNYVYACGSNGTNGVFIRSTDGGLNWQIININRPLFINKISFTDSLNGYAAASDNTTSTGTIYKTTDGGYTWSLVHTVGKLMVSCMAIDANNCIAVGLGGNILVTKDGGANWVNKSNYTNDIYGIKKLNATKFYACGGAILDSTFIYTSADAGETWKKEYIGYKGRLSQLSFNTAGRLFCSGQNGIVLRSAWGTAVPTIQQQTNLMLYPNPAKNVLHIGGLDDINGSCYTVFSLDGRVVKNGTLLSNQLSIADLNTGIYLLQIKTPRSDKRILQRFQVL